VKTGAARDTWRLTGPRRRLAVTPCSFVFLPLSADIPRSLRSKVKEVLGEKNAVALRLRAGRWTAYYEQFDAPQANMVGLYRNIVLTHTAIRQGAEAAKGYPLPFHNV
jgi:hypothetical protein